MIRFISEFQVAGSIDAAFDLISDVENYRQWVASSSLVFRGTVVTSAQSKGLGLTFVDQVRFGGKSVGEVTVYDPPTRFVIEQTTYYGLPFFTARFVYQLKGDKNRAHVKHTTTARALGLFRPVEPILRSFIRRERTMTCQGIARELENPSG